MEGPRRRPLSYMALSASVAARLRPSSKSSRLCASGGGERDQEAITSHQTQPENDRKPSDPSEAITCASGSERVSKAP